MENTNSNTWLSTALILVVVIAGLFLVAGGNVSKDEVKDIVVDEMNKLNIPTATEIASEIVIEVPEWEVPVIPEFESDDKVNDLWEDLYSAIIAEIKSNATEDATLELEDMIYEAEEDEDGDFYDFLKLNILNFKEIDDVDFEVEEVKVINLGLEDKENKVAQVVFELDVEYTLTEGPINDVYEKTIFVTANVVYEEGDFTDEEVELVFALE